MLHWLLLGAGARTRCSRSHAQHREVHALVLPNKPAGGKGKLGRGVCLLHLCQLYPPQNALCSGHCTHEGLMHEGLHTMIRTLPALQAGHEICMQYPDALHSVSAKNRQENGAHSRAERAAAAGVSRGVSLQHHNMRNWRSMTPLGSPHM